MIRFHSLITHLYDNSGHRFIYHICFRRAIKQLGYGYKGYTNKANPIPGAPEDWERVLSWKNVRTPLKKLFQLFRRAFDFSKLFARKSGKTEKRIFFLESLCIVDLLALTCSILLFFKRKDRFWLLLRYDLRSYPKKWIIYSLCFKMIQKKLKQRFLLLSDSDRIGLFFEEKLYQKVHIVPIPHTEKRDAKRIARHKTVLWWPGRPGKDKGSAEIMHLARQICKKPTELWLSQEAQPWIKQITGSLSLSFLKPFFSREEYLHQFSECDAVLLPYDPNIYYSRTSGIFVETVFAGKLPFVREGSWLAYELHKHHLPELILDWSHPDLMSSIQQAIDSKEIRKRFDQMQRHYHAFHSFKTYTQKIEKLAALCDN